MNINTKYHILVVLLIFLVTSLACSFSLSSTPTINSTIEASNLPTRTTNILPTRTTNILPNSIKVITSANANLVTQLAYINARSTIAWLPNSNILVSSHSGSSVDFWEIGSQFPKYSFDAPPWGLSFSPDGKWFASGFFQENDWGLFNSSDGSLVKRVTGHSDSVITTAFSPNNDMIATSSYDNTIRLWHLPDLTLIRVLEGHERYIESVAFSPDGELLVSGSIDGTVRLWRTSDGAQLSWGGVSDSQPFYWVKSVAFSPNGEYIAAGGSGNGSEGKIQIWRVSDRTQVFDSVFNNWLVDGVVFSPNNEILAVSSSPDLYLLRASDGMILSSLLGSPEDPGLGGMGPYVVFSPDGALLASGSGSNYVYVWGLSK